MPTAEEQTSTEEKQQPPNKDTEQQEEDEEEDEEEEEEAEENVVKRRRRKRRRGGDEEEDSDWSSSSSSDSDSDSDAESEPESDSEPLVYVRPGQEREDGDENTEENNIRRLGKILNPKKLAKEWAEEEEVVQDQEQLFDFPEDPENWREEDLRELWEDAPLGYTKPGWDPDWADEEDWKVMRKEAAEGREPPIKPFYVPYRQPYPVIPDNHRDIATPKDVIHELDRTEEFLKWVSYIFPDESTYEGTVWDDMAHGRGVFVAQNGLVRYEGEWFQNDLAGHGVVEVEIPTDEPIPGSEHEAQMRAEGRVIDRDFMSPEDREWLEMDIEDSFLLADGEYQTPWYERDEWITYYGRKPEKGRYRYAGEFKHGRMHGCGQYEVNERTIYGRFYFGKLLEERYGCEDEIAAMHAGIAEVAAAKARMFINKPDGMVREMRGPYSDPQHPYFYEEDDVWMAPGFINQFYDVPDYWKRYVGEVDKERQMWLNSFYRSPLRLPMPAELEYWWQHDDTPEFVFIDSEPKPDGEEKSAEPRILHTPSGRIINSRVDKEHGIRLYWEPENGVVDPDKIEYLPLGMDEFFGLDTAPEKESLLTRFLSVLEKKSKEHLEKVEKWVDERVELAELKMELLDRELDLEEAEKCLEEALKEVEDNLKTREKEEESSLKEEGKEETLPRELEEKQDEKVVVGEDEGEDEEDDEEDDDDDASASFGSAIGNQNSNKSDPKGGKPGQSPFSASSLSFATSTLVSGIPSLLQRSFLSWKKSGSMAKTTRSLCRSDSLPRVDTVSFPALSFGSETQSLKLQAKKNHRSNEKVCRISSLASLTKPKMGNGKRGRQRSCGWLNVTPESDLETVLSLHTPLDYLGKLEETYNDDAKPLSSSV